MRSHSALLAVTLALLSGIATFLVLHPIGRAHSEPATEAAVVALRAIEVGAVLDAADFDVERVRVGSSPSDAIRDPEELRGRYASAPLLRGEVVRQSRVSSTPPGSKLAGVIPQGRVAISVAVSDVISTGGLISPGDHVDVLGVVSREATSDAQLVLSDVLVLAVSSNITGADAAPPRTQKSGANTNPKGLDTTITLAVSQSEAQRLVQVDEVGRLRLALRPRIESALAVR